jgi:hypothetical protein
MADEKTFRPLLYVMIAGAVGGLTSWLLQWRAGLTPFQKPAIFGIPALVVVGAVAAVLGVYLIANSDTTELRHTLAFALVCGIFWQPVFDAAKLYVTHSVTEHQASAQAQANDTLSASAKVQDPAGIKSKVADVAAITAQVLGRAPSVQDTDLKDKVVAQSNQSIEAIGKASDKAPQQAIQSLQAIGEAAVQSGQTDVARPALGQLSTIEAQNPSVAVEARATQQQIYGVGQMRLDKLKSSN